jgi:L-fuculose-phosphate aldolase
LFHGEEKREIDSIGFTMIDNNEFKKLANRMINACKRLHAQGILAGPGGNISVRSNSPNVILCSPSGIPIMDMMFDDMCVIDISGTSENHLKILKGKYQPTVEILLHIGIYTMRPEVKAVIHSHPPITTAFSCTSRKINYKIVEDQSWYIGNIDSIPFTSSSSDLVDMALPKLKNDYALILKNHGILSLGDSLLEAVTITELIEYLSKLYYQAISIDGGKIIEIPKDYWTRVHIEPRSSLIYHDEIFD